VSADVVRVEGLKKYFILKEGFFKGSAKYVHAVDGVDLWIPKGKTLGLVGESGCGKTTVGRCILRLEEPTAGKIYMDGTEITKIPLKEIRPLRRNMQIVFQDPFSSLNPRQTVLKAVGEPLTINKISRGDELRDSVQELLAKVNLPKDAIYRFPHEFSGGQRQRICVARALALNPKFIVLDEPTSALDVSVQSQVLNQLLDLQKDLDLTYLFISHNLIVEKYVCDRIAVMYLGKVMENADKDDLFAEPMHPYTQALLFAIPLPDPTLHRKRTIIKGDVPSPVNPPGGCRFHTRCPKAMPVCSKEEPPLKKVGKGRYDHFVACHLY